MTEAEWTIRWAAVRTRLRVAATVVVCVVLLVGLISYIVIRCLPASRPDVPRAVPNWPTVGEIDHITVTVNAIPDWDEPAIPEFVLPPEHMPALLRVLAPPEYYQHPQPSPDTPEVARLAVVCRDGRALDIRLRYYYKSPALFTVDDVPCRRAGPYCDLAPTGTGPKFMPEVGILHGYLQAVHRGDREKACLYLDLLDRSAGRAGPEK